MPFLALHSGRRRKRIQRQRRRRRTGAVRRGRPRSGSSSSLAARRFRRRRRALGLLQPLEPEAGQHRREHVRLRRRRLVARLDPGRPQPRARSRSTRMSAWLPKATVAVEDRRFYQHGGIDYVGHRARALGRRQRREGRRGRLDDHPAARAQHVHGPRADLRPQAQGGLPRDQAQRQVVEDEDPPDLPEHRLLRQPRLRRRGGRRDVLLAARAEPQPRRRRR